MSVINQALKDLQKRQQHGTARPRSVYQAPQRRWPLLGLGIGAGVVGGMFISYLMITHAMGGPAREVGTGEQGDIGDHAVVLQLPIAYEATGSTAVAGGEVSENIEPEEATQDTAAVLSGESPENTAADELVGAAEVSAGGEPVPVTPVSAQPTVELHEDGEQGAEDSNEAQGSMRVERVERSADELAAQRLEQAIEAIDGGRGRRGESLLQEALILRPDYTEARQRLAGYYYGRGFSSEAIRILQEGLAQSPNSTTLLALMARIYEETNRPAEALRMLNRLNVQLPEHSELLVLRAAMANELGHYSSAAEDYRALLNMNPHQGIWWLGLGYAEEQQGDLAAAELAYEQALADERLDRESRNYVRSRMEALNVW